MTISELIERLEALKAEHGDLPVVTYDSREDFVDPEPDVANVMNQWVSGTFSRQLCVMI